MRKHWLFTSRLNSISSMHWTGGGIIMISNGSRCNIKRSRNNLQLCWFFSMYTIALHSRAIFSCWGSVSALLIKFDYKVATDKTYEITTNYKLNWGKSQIYEWTLKSYRKKYRYLITLLINYQTYGKLLFLGHPQSSQRSKLPWKLNITYWKNHL